MVTQNHTNIFKVTQTQKESQKYRKRHAHNLTKSHTVTQGQTNTFFIRFLKIFYENPTHKTLNEAAVL